MTTTTIIETLAAILASAFFSGLEIAFVSSNKLRVEMDRAERRGVVSRALHVFYRRPGDFISTLLVGNNIALVVYGLLMAMLIPVESIPVQIALSTLVMLVLGEFLPKTIFRLNPNIMMRALALPAMVCHIVLWPLSKLTALTSRLLLRSVGVRVRGGSAKPVFTKADLDHLIQTNIEEAREGTAEEVRFFQNALDFRSVKVRECMVPRTEIDAVETSQPLADVRAKFIETGHSKLMAYHEDIDEIVGFVHSSEMFTLTDGDDWTGAIRQTAVVPETMSAQRLMQSMLREKRSIAVVVDEFGGTSGIVTLEDLVEEIFGDITDEHDRPTLTAKQTAPGEYLLSARLEIDQANERLGLDLPESEDYLTIGGLLLHRHQSLPKANEIIGFGKWEFKVIKSSNTKIELVRLRVR